VLTDFVNEDGEALGRPVGVAIDRTGALLVADDVGNRNLAGERGVAQE
jgi:glucose/arabinose dehydrogenase